MRVIALVLGNIFWNQISILVRSRVTYDRDMFNYEEYRQRGMTDNRLVKNTFFMPAGKGAKNMVVEFFKFHLKENMVDIQIRNSDKFIHNFNVMATHVVGLEKVEKIVDIEPILRKCLVNFY